MYICKGVATAGSAPSSCIYKEVHDIKALGGMCVVIAYIAFVHLPPVHLSI